jgi:hypothetical protein
LVPDKPTIIIFYTAAMQLRYINNSNEYMNHYVHPVRASNPEYSVPLEKAMTTSPCLLGWFV